MKSSRYVSLLTTIDEAIDEEDFEEALELISTNFERVDDAALLRERIAVILASAGRKKEAVEVWDHLARHWANIGDPMRSLAAIKQMQRLRPEATALLDHFSTLYEIQSPYLSQEASPPAPSASSSELELEIEADSTDLDELLDHCARMATDAEGLVDQPGELPPIPLLSLLPSGALRHALDHLEYEIFADIEPVIEAGELSEQLIWTITADFVVRDREPPLRLPSGALVGLKNFGRSAAPSDCTVWSNRSSELLRLDSEAIAALDEQLGDFRNRIATLRRHALTEGLLQRHPMFADLEEEERLELIGDFTGVHVSRGEVVIKQGAPSPGMFVILDGEVDVVRLEDGWEITIATLSAGEVFGEIGLVSESESMAKCVMTTPGHLLYLSRKQFGEVAQRHPTLAKYAVNLASERMEDVETTLSAKDLAEVE